MPLLKNMPQSTPRRTKNYLHFLVEHATAKGRRLGRNSDAFTVSLAGTVDTKNQKNVVLILASLKAI